MTMETPSKNSQLLAALREGVAMVQMVLFKEIRNCLTKKKPHCQASHLGALAGAITNEVFGSPNPGDTFVRFRKENKGEIEQELLMIKDELPHLCADVTDALRIQTLCDHQEGVDTSKTLLRAKEFGYLLEEREIPLPSSFMTLVRALGEKHRLIVPPVQINPSGGEVTVH